MRHIAIALSTAAVLAGCGTASGTNLAASLAEDEKPCPRCVRIFDGKTWDGWVSKKGWSITPEGVLRGEPGGERAVHTTRSYGSFRLFVTSRMNPRNGDHLGILFWGPAPSGEEAYKKNIQFQPPHGAMWDYFVNDDNIGETRHVRGERIDETWHLTEILANYNTGTMRAAVNGVELTTYKSPDHERRWQGPIGMQRHGKGVSEYKEIWIEADPVDDLLISVHGTN